MVTCLLALRLLTVPVHKIEQPVAYQRQQQQQAAADVGAMGENEPGADGAPQRLTTITAEQWLPPAALLSLLGPIVLLRAAEGLFSTGLFLLQPSSPPGGEPR
ncbi:hypothetical protein PtA15_18A348 [Puccinia triticina]|uniref:Solute carrier family 40 protein n=1 Tax=Puccinia triticina TaxID=208348 RepID=A0ABY7D890_9BASI|nr:uncharacterized protein PtA15_18A348 [Puccinia triticina]WAQ93288.1 hypothetical protein PtA15_18A348 [Puccinia triticina]